ncbi:MAG: porin [Gammaproteobacteria bacterium]|nr:porin [Gammaproteobacteria bacterium]
MKKKLLAAAVAAAIAMPGTSFAAATIFGHAHVSLDYLDDSDNSGLSVASNTSRIGVKGSEDLGNGLAAIYHMEWGVALDSNGDSDLGARNRFGGFKHDSLGTVVLGRHDTPVKVIGRKVDLFWSTQLGQNRSITNIKDGGKGFDARANNVIGYISPHFGPVHVFAAYMTSLDDGGIETDRDDDAYSIAAILDQKIGDGKLFAAVGFESHDLGTDDDESALRLTGKYNTGGALTVAGFVQLGADLGGVAGADRKLYGGGVAYKMGSNTLKGAIYLADELDTVADSGALHYSVGIDHALSKNTVVYGLFTALDTDDGADLTLGGSGSGSSVSIPGGETGYAVSFGTRIKF